nr:hypothetical protein [uncultured Carboxylicivirga sp.]
MTTTILKTAIIISLLLGVINSYAETSYKEGESRVFSQFDTDSPNELITESEVEVDDELENQLSEAFEQMDGIKKFVIDSKRLVNKLDSAVFLTLPIGLTYNSNSDKVEDPNYMIVINEATIHPGYAEFSAFMSIQNPLDGQIIRFKASNIKFSFKSGLRGGFKLELISSVKTKLIGNSEFIWLEGSFVDWDCNGFKSLGINAQINLNKDKFIKVDPSTGKLSGQVSSSFFVSAAGIDDIVVATSFDPFKIAGFDEAYFGFTNVILDYSDTFNADNFTLPANYPGNFTGDKSTLWRGFFVQEADIYLTKKIESKDSIVTKFYAHNLYLDDFGLTGEMGGSNILSLDKGSLGGWNMSLESFSLEFFTGDFKGLEFEGKVLVKGTSDPLAYDAFFDVDGNYHFGISLGRDIGFDVFAAKLNIDESSMINVDVQDNKFCPSVNLNGDISFALSKNSSSLLGLPGIEFQGLQIATVAPVFDVDYIGLTSSKNLFFNEFPITLSDIKVSDKGSSRKSFDFTINVNLTSSGSMGLSAGTSLGVVANLGVGEWSFHQLEVNALYVDIEKPGSFELHGEVLFIDGDPIYGNGFRGRIDAKFAGTLDLKAVAVFGKIDGFRYFFVDAYVMLGKAGTQMGPLTVNGFGGGLFYRMRQASVSDSGSKIGESLSGINYVPDKSKSISIRAALTGGIIRPELIECEVSFGIDFTNSFGLSRIFFKGEANVMDISEAIGHDRIKAITQKVIKNEKVNIQIPGQVSASVDMLMDFEAHTFHTEMELIVNVAGILKGVGDNNKAGWGVVHIDPDKWYIHLGTPSDPIGLKFINLMQVGGYFMAGHDVPDAIMMNPKVLEILNLDNTAFDGGRSNENLISGNGIAFGANFSIDTGDLTFLIFYARLEMGGGFDISLLDYGPNVYCEDGPLHPGINGWYAKGQAYAYFAGKIGIKVKVFGRKRTYDIINLQLAAAIRLEGPNPTWFMGVVGGKYRILGGLIKGNCSFEVSVGEKCEMRQLKDLSDLEVIADLTPAQDTKDVGLYTMPQAVFNMPVDKIIKISDDPGLSKTFKIKLEEFAVYDANGTVYPGITEWNADKTSIAYRSEEIFDKDSKYTVKAAISFEEFVNNQWQAYKGDDGKTYYETKEATFETGPLPTEIDPTSVQYSYPVDRMVNFYKQEYNKAYISLYPGAAPFFENTPGYTQKVRWTQVNGEAIYSELTYNKQKRMVETNVPANLVNDAIYHFELVHVPTSESTSIDRNISENTEQALNEEDGNTTEITTREAEGVIGDSEEKAFLSFAFRCSKYNKFLEKFPQNEYEVDWIEIVGPAEYYPGSNVYAMEMFDKAEIIGLAGNTPLVTTFAYLPAADWYEQNIAKYLYHTNYLKDTTVITWRNIDNIGIPPIKNITYKQNYSQYILSDANVETGICGDINTNATIIYELPKFWILDYLNVRNRISNLYEKGNIELGNVESYILNTFPCPQPSLGNYPIKISYTLPGINKVSSSKILNMPNRQFDRKQVNLID